METPNPDLDTSRLGEDDSTTVANVLTARAILEEATEGSTMKRQPALPQTSWVRRLMNWLRLR